MHLLKRLFDFYLQASIHVALSAFALVKMTQHQFAITNGDYSAYFVFFGTIVGYNFVKYDALARVGSKIIGRKLKAIVVLSSLCFLAALYFFFQLALLPKIIAALFLVLTTLYTLPFFPNRKNARNWAGIKIYIVAICWVGVTLFLPLIDAGIPFETKFFLKCVQRFLLIFTLILIFEILDLAKDDPHLQTVPQQIGVRRTKILGISLLLLFYIFDFVNYKYELSQLAINAVIVIITAALLLFANPKRSKYYSAFWTESIPILWWLLLIFI